MRWNGNEIDVNQTQERTINNENSNVEETMLQEEADTTDKIFIVTGSIASVLVLGIVGIRIWKEKDVTG